MSPMMYIWQTEGKTGGEELAWQGDRKTSDSIHTKTVSQETVARDMESHIYTIHSPTRQTQGCRSRRFENVPSWCWTRHPECPAETVHTHKQRRCLMRPNICKSTLSCRGPLVFIPLTLTTSSPSIILSFSRFSLRSSGRVLHLSSPSRPTEEERHTEKSFCSAALPLN